jgi:hypothetical protein
MNDVNVSSDNLVEQLLEIGRAIGRIDASGMRLMLSHAQDCALQAQRELLELRREVALFRLYGRDSDRHRKDAM